MDEISDNQGHRGRGRPRSQTAESHTAILNAVYALLQEQSVRDVTMEAIAKQAGVGKPTLYKWWPTKAALVMALLKERLADSDQPTPADTAEASIRGTVHLLIAVFNGPFGKIMADLIAEGQSEPAILHELFNRHIAPQRAETVAEIEQGKVTGEFAVDSDPEVLIDAIFGAIYYRLLLRSAPLTQEFGEQVVTQVLRGVRSHAY